MEAMRLSAPCRLSFSAALRARDSAIFKAVTRGRQSEIFADSKMELSACGAREWCTRVATEIEPSVEKTFARSSS